MKKLLLVICACVSFSALKAFAQSNEMVKLSIDLPPTALPISVPFDIRSPNLEPHRRGKPRPPIYVPVGTKVISIGCKVTSSDLDPIIGSLDLITDGNKKHSEVSYIEVGPGTQWVQVDLGVPKSIYAICIWHYHGALRLYKDVICQISNDPEFKEYVTAVFNNDHDNSSGVGKGKDKEYIETCRGRSFSVKGVKGRYIRFYSRGDNHNEMNHYTEIEIFGR